MAKITPGAIISEIAGSIANTTYSRSRAGAIVKAKLVQPPSNTPEQAAARALHANAVAAWQLLSQSERNQWLIFGESQQSRRRIDGTHQIGGYNAFIRFFVVRQTYGLAGNPSISPKIALGNYSNFSIAIIARHHVN